MEVRCGNCNKLFRVSDDKISGKGIKFVCTRCGEYVKITINDFTNYTLSKTVASALDVFAQKPTSTAAEMESKTAQITEETSVPASESPAISAAELTHDVSKEIDLKAPSVPGFLQENKAPGTTDLSHLEEPSYQIEQSSDYGLGTSPQFAAHHEPSDVVQAEQEQKPEQQPEVEKGVTKAIAVPESESVFQIVDDEAAAVHSEPEKSSEPQLIPEEELSGEVVVAYEPKPAVDVSVDTMELVHREQEKSPEPHLGQEEEFTVQSLAVNEPEPPVEMPIETTQLAHPEPEESPEPQEEAVGETEQESVGSPETEPVIESVNTVTVAVQPEQKSEIQLESQLEGTSEIKQESPLPGIYHPVPESQPLKRTTPATILSTPAAQKKESAHRLSSSTSVITAEASESPRSSSQAIIIVSAIIILALGGIGAFMLLRSPGTTTKESATNMVSMQGLRIVNASGSVEPNGDLVISGVVENSADKPQYSWLVVVDVFDAQGTMINKLRLLNGKQIYMRSDYDIFAKRGVQIQEMKAKALQEQGTIIPPKDKVTFEIRYLQPPAGIASFNATLQPFDPGLLSKEAADQLN